jgi:hypothetical protein
MKSNAVTTLERYYRKGLTHPPGGLNLREGKDHCPSTSNKIMTVSYPKYDLDHVLTMTRAG